MNWIVTSLAAAITWGVLYVSAEQVMKTTDKYAYLSVAFLVNLIFFSCIALYQQTFHTLKSIGSDPKWFILVVISSLLGNFLTFTAVQQKSATHAAAIEISYPFWCAIITILFLHHSPITAKQFLGLIIAVFGTVIFIVSER